MRKRSINKKIIFSLCIILLCSFFTGCNLNLKEMVNSNKTKIDINQTKINNQTSSLGIDLSKNGAKLDNGEFYVLHEGIYYPAYMYMSNFEDSSDIPNNVPDNKELYYLTSNEYDIPTLFINKGDKLIYYDENNVIDYIFWERYKDLGYTLGVYDLKETTSGRYYINIKDGASVITGTEVANILNDVNSKDTQNILVDKVENTTISDDLVEDGIIKGALRNQNYSLDLYVGTQYHHYNTTASVHAFKDMEQFASIEYNTLREYTYEIQIPDYFVDGYYKLYAQGIGGSAYTGLIRIVYEDEFDLLDADTFNKTLLNLYTEEDKAKMEAGKSVDKKMSTYSTYAPLNKYKTEVVGSLGYKTEVKDTVSKEKKKTTLTTASIRQFNINLQDSKNCKISLAPKKTEPSGEVYIYIGNDKETLKYNNITNSYDVELKGDGNTYTLFVSGIWGSYDITLTNCNEDKIGTSKSVIPSRTESITNNSSKDDKSSTSNDATRTSR